MDTPEQKQKIESMIIYYSHKKSNNYMLINIIDQICL